MEGIGPLCSIVCWLQTSSRLWWHVLWPNLQYIFSSEILKDTDVCLSITGAIRGTLKEKLYKELGLESLENRRWFRDVCPFSEILKNKSPDYLYNIFPQRISSYITRNIEAVPLLDNRHSFCENSFFPVNHNKKESSRSRT